MTRIGPVFEAEVTRAYGAVHAMVSPIRSGQGGATVWEVVLDGKRYALRISGPSLSARPEWIEFEGAFLAHGSNNGVPVACAVTGLDGRYGQRVGDGVALMTEWADGDVEWPTPAHKAKALGRVSRQRRS